MDLKSFLRWWTKYRILFNTLVWTCPPPFSTPQGSPSSSFAPQVLFAPVRDTGYRRKAHTENSNNNDLCCQRIVNDFQHTSISHYLITRTASSTPRNTDSLLGRLLHLRAGVVALSKTHYAVHHCLNLERTLWSRGNWCGCNLVSL